MDERPMLSICIVTYNHEKYIVQAMESVLMQQTQYSYEVLIGEDCSTDRTREILKEYEKNLPANFKIFYREHNMYHEMIGNALDLEMRCRGKYVIVLEGDDFWIDPYKIEKQITFLETHPEYIGVSHKCIVVDDDSKPWHPEIEKYLGCSNEDYSLNHYLNGILPGQTTTLMYRSEYLHELDHSDLYLSAPKGPGDRLLYYFLAVKGKLYCSDEKMSAYRYVTDKGSSFSATYRYRFQEDEQYYLHILNYSYTLKHADAQTCAEILYIRALKRGIRQGECSYLLAACKILKNVRHKRVLITMLKARGEGYKVILKS